MKRFLMPVSALAVLAVVLLLANPLVIQAAPTDKDVRVINTTAEPVPTAAQGTTTIAGNVSVTNTPTVNLAPGSSVAVTAATPLRVVDVNNGIQPFQKYVGATNTGTNVHTFSLGTVPAGKRLVIEFVSAHGQVPAGEHVELFHLNTVAGPFGGATHDLLVQAQPAAVSGDAIFRASQQVRIYADPGTTVTALIRTSTLGTTTCAIAISGYLVDL